MPQAKAAEQGCSQVLWLFPELHTASNDFYITGAVRKLGGDRVTPFPCVCVSMTECGSMNLFVYWKNNGGFDELTTFPLDDELVRDEPNLFLTERKPSCLIYMLDVADE